MHRQITDAIGTEVYFCDAHSPWQRPTNENTNGLFPGHSYVRHGERFAGSFGESRRPIEDLK